jgi:hypothetical protein
MPLPRFFLFHAALSLGGALTLAGQATATPNGAEPQGSTPSLAPVRKAASPERPAPSRASGQAANPSRKPQSAAHGLDAEPRAAASAEQLRAAERVMYGRYQCEEGQQVRVSAPALHPGYVSLEHGARRYWMRPLQSSSGAIRLEGLTGETLVVQIASKSMLLNVKTGQRILDGCVRVEAETTLQGDGPANPAPTRP